jgi:hypothetical protein
MVLIEILAFEVLVQAALAGGFLGGYDVWKSWHGNLGDFLALLPLASLVLGLALRHRQPESVTMLVSRFILLIMVFVVVATGHEAGALLAAHIPAAVATVGILVRQAATITRAREVQR